MDGGMVFLCPPLCVLCAVLIGQFILINNVFVPERLFACARACVCVFGVVMHPCECVLVRHAFCPLCVFFSFLCVGCAAHPVAVPLAGTASGLDPYQHAPAQTE